MISVEGVTRKHALYLSLLMVAQNLPAVDDAVDSSGTKANFKNLRMRQNKGSSKTKNNKLKENSLTKKSTLVCCCCMLFLLMGL